AVMKAVETRRLELTEAIRNHSTPARDAALESMTELHVDAVGDQMPSAEPLCVTEQFVDAEADRRVVRGDHGACTDANDRVDADAAACKLAKHADVCGAAKAAGAQ